MRDKNKQIDQHLIAWAFDLKVFKEHVKAKVFIGLFNNVIPVEILKSLAGRTINFTAKRDEWKSTGNTSLEVEVIC